VPVRCPGELAEAGDAARLGHAREAEIEPVGKQPGHQDAAVGRALTGAQMGEAVREAGPARHLGQQIGDADARQHGVEPVGQCLGLRRCRFLDRRDLQHAIGDRHLRQPAGSGLGINRLQPLVQQRLAAGDELIEVMFDSDRQGAGLQQLLQRLRRDQPLLEGAVLPAAGDPDVAGAQPVTQLRQHAKLIMAPVDGAAGQDIGRPTLPHEAGRRGFRQASPGAVRLAQQHDRAHQRGAGGHALKIERVQESGGPAADAGIMLAELLERVELLRTGQRLGFRDRGTKPLPRDHRGDRAIGILLVIAGRDERGADAGIEADLLVDRPRIGLEGAGVPSLGLAEHRADQPVEQVDGLVGQAGSDVERGGDQCRVPTLPLITGDMLHRGALGLAGQLRQARLVDEVAAPRLDADGAHMLQPLDEAEHGGGLGRLRHLPQPGEPAQTASLPMFGQGVEALALFGGKPPGQPAMRLPARAVAQISTQTLQCCGRRDDDAARAARLHHRSRQEGESVVLDRLREQCLCHLGGSKPAERTQPELPLALDHVALPVPLRREIFVDAVRKSLDLICNERP